MSIVAAPAAAATSRDVTSLAVLGALGLASLLITGVALRLNDTIDWNLVVLLMLLSGGVTIAATRVASQAPAGLGLAIVLGVALALRLLALSWDPILSSDIYRYVWDGWVQGAGINPYRYVPADAALAMLRDGVIFPNINRADYAITAYPPVAQFFFYAVTRVGASVTTMRLAFVGCEAVTLILLIDLLRRLDKPVTLAVAYAWHPLAVWEIANAGHVEALMVMLVMFGTWLLVRHRRIVAGVAIALATLVKPYAIVALPACWRPWDWRLPLAVIGTVVACYLPYWGVGKDVFGFLLTGYLTEEGLQGGDGFWLVFVARTLFGNVSGLMPLYLALAAAVLGYFALRVCFTPDDTPERTIRNVALLLMAGLFFLTPNYPWYFLVVVPFIPIGGGAPAWALSLGAILLNLLYPDYEARFLVWKGVIVIGFIVAVTATMQPTLLARLEGTLRWKR